MTNNTEKSVKSLNLQNAESEKANETFPFNKKIQCDHKLSQLTIDYKSIKNHFYDGTKLFS